MSQEKSTGRKIKTVLHDTLRTTYRNSQTRSMAKSLIAWATKKANKANKHYVFSVVIPVYNAEAYLEETFDCLLNQSVGFANTQVILVNDGSSDNSEALCQKLAAKYRKNVVALSQSNKGVSAARNLGLEHAEGYFIGFLDSDDLYSNDYFFEVLKFARKNPSVNVFTSKTTYFGRTTSGHPLNYICGKNAVINLDDQFGMTPLSAARSIFTYKAVKGHKFKEGLRFTEDSLFVNEILVDQPVFGALSKPSYLYRKHEDNDSSSDGVAENPHWYCEVLKESHLVSFDLARKQWGHVPRFMQNTVAYDLMWRIRTVIPESISDDIASEYRELMTTLLKDIEDDVLLSNRCFDLGTRLYALSLKHNVPSGYFDKMVTSGGPNLTLLGEPSLGMDRVVAVTNLLGWSTMRIDIIDYDKKTNSLQIEGCFPKLRIASDKAKGEFRYNNVAYEMEFFNHPHGLRPCAFADDATVGLMCFRACIPVGNGGTLSALVSLNDGTPSKPILTYGVYSHLLGRDTHSYSVLDDSCLIYLDGFKRELCVSTKAETPAMIEKRERTFQNELSKLVAAEDWLPLRKRALEWRKNNPNTRIWLFTDRVTSAEDSGEVMFRYVIDHPLKDVEPIFIIRDDVPDYERLKQYGKVLPAGSQEHLEAVVNAEVIISSAGDKWVHNPFDDGQPFLRDLLHFKYVFLQHGVIKESLADWLYKPQKHIDLFVTSAQRERQSIIEGTYGYDEDQVILTGLPRWDSFEHSKDETKRVIYLMPTWRQYLAGDYSWNAAGGEDVIKVVKGFEETDYCKFFRSVLEDEKLGKLLEEYDYTLKFAPHPRIGQAIDAFKGNDRIQILKPESFAYSDAYREMSLFITDYSSAAFNVAILKKPIVYVQFDKDRFYRDHTGKKDYYDYEDDGFGPVFKTKDELVEYIHELLETNMTMGEKYAQRVNDFFFWPPNGEPRAKLVLDEVLELLDRPEDK